MTLIGGIEVPEKGVKIIHRPDHIVNLIHDLPDSKHIFHMLEIYKASELPGKMMYRDKKAGLYMILVYRYPKWMEPEEADNPSQIALFVSSSLAALIKFFYIWFNKEDQVERKNILFEIQNLLYEHQKIEREENSRAHL